MSVYVYIYMCVCLYLYMSKYLCLCECVCQCLDMPTCAYESRSDERDRQRMTEGVGGRNKITFVEEEYPILTIVPFIFVVVPSDFTAFTPS